MTQALERPVAAFDPARTALFLDALVGRLTYDKDFAAELANNPRAALERAGLVMDKASVEELIRTDPDRFDKASEALFGLVDSDFLHAIDGPSCEFEPV